MNHLHFLTLPPLVGVTAGRMQRKNQQQLHVKRLLVESRESHCHEDPNLPDAPRSRRERSWQLPEVRNYPGHDGARPALAGS